MENYGEFYLQTTSTAIGANFAPSYANLTMGFWEAHNIWRNNLFLAHVAFYGCYIDDVVIIWDGSETDVTAFVSHCNANEYGLSFTSICDGSSLAFLDLTLCHDEDKIYATNYIKPTAGNSFPRLFPPPGLVKNIPKSQLPFFHFSFFT